MKKFLMAAAIACSAFAGTAQTTAKADPSVGPPQFYRNGLLADGSLLPHTAYTLKVNVKNLINSETVPPGGFSVVIKLGTGLAFNSSNLSALSVNYTWTADGTTDPTQVILKGVLNAPVDMFYNEDLLIPVTTVNSVISQNYLLSTVQINPAVIKGANLTLNDEAGSLYKISSATLPVLFVSFDVQATADCGAKALWEVGTETDVKGYYLEQSTDGVQYKAVAFVTAENKRSYSAELPAVGNGLRFYRIRQTDNNGAFTYSKVFRLNACPGVRTGWAITAYPNPLVTNNTVTVKNNNGAFLQKVTVQVTAADGRQVMQQAIDSRRLNQFTLNVAGLPQGQYLLTVADAEGSEAPQSFKLTVLK